MENYIWVPMHNIPRSIYKEITLFLQWEEQALAAKQSVYLPAKEDIDLLLCFYNTDIYYYYT